ncbi:MAG: serine/threonine protein kinase, partial [Bifidobacteriaceae bacterium]|nr:serine/threonine protein kinase [Bifidobacteriaceae bacterium]
MRADPGLLLADGRYQLITRIAVGGMGEVWRAHDLWTDGPVAIKVLRPEYTGDPTSLQRLRIEAHNASMLVHPNIAAVHDYREQEGTGYLVMEYVDGQSMADVLASHSTIAPLRLLPILIQASLGLHAAHTAGVVHRDVKPGNILLGPSDQVKLTDFGISIAQGQMSLTDTGKVMGTAQYLAPEQALGNPATPLGDLYALGIIAYESLVGERPFTGVNHVAIALSQVRDAPPPLPSSVEPSLAELVMRLLSKDPAERPQTGADLAAELSGVLDIHRQLAGRLLAARRGSDLGGPLLRTEASAGRTETHDQPPTFTPVARDPVPPTEVADLVIEPISAIDLAPELLPQPTSGPIVQVPVPDVDQPAPAQAPAPAPVALAAPSGEVDLPVIVSPP